MNVLAAVDFGDSSLEALRQGRALAHAAGGRLAVCHVLPAVPDASFLFPERPAENTAELTADEEAARRALVDHARTKLGLELTEVFVERGPAYAEIVRRAETWGAGTIVVGSHGRRGIARAVLGSVAERVVRHAHCSVLVARPVRKPGVVLAATDLSDASLPAVVEGAAAAKRLGARLVVVSSVEWAEPISISTGNLIGVASPAPTVELKREVADALKSTLEQALVRLGVEGEVRPLEGSPAAQIVDAADELDAELVVVGTHGRTGLRRLALGSVAERVVRSVHTSVLAVRVA
ncbi:MAG TPA: universal stress protein [Polyangiaceae bacterium]|nr:universal stress protein [Polyangiaceae bacterium]